MGYEKVKEYDSSRTYSEQLKVYKALMPNGKGADRE